jgi:hypothetical protein
VAAVHVASDCKDCRPLPILPGRLLSTPVTTAYSRRMSSCQVPQARFGQSLLAQDPFQGLFGGFCRFGRQNPRQIPTVLPPENRPCRPVLGPVFRVMNWVEMQNFTISARTPKMAKNSPFLGCLKSRVRSGGSKNRCIFSCKTRTHGGVEIILIQGLIRYPFFLTPQKGCFLGFTPCAGG